MQYESAFFPLPFVSLLSVTDTASVAFLVIEVKGIKPSFVCVEFKSVHETIAHGSYTACGAWKFKQDKNSVNLT